VYSRRVVFAFGLADTVLGMITTIRSCPRCPEFSVQAYQEDPQDSVASTTAGTCLPRTLTHDQDFHIKMSFANGVCPPLTSPVDAGCGPPPARSTSTSRLAQGISRGSSTPPASKASFQDCPATPFKWSVTTRISPSLVEKGGPPGTIKSL
jgi:hypothetical protein